MVSGWQLLCCFERPEGCLCFSTSSLFLQSVLSADTIIRTVLKSGSKHSLFTSKEWERCHLILELSGWTVSTAPLCKLQMEQVPVAENKPCSSGRGKTRSAASTTQTSPVVQQSFGEAPMFIHSHSTAANTFRTLPENFQGTNTAAQHFSSWQPLFWEMSVEGSPSYSLQVLFSLKLDHFAWWPKLYGQDYPGNDDIFFSCMRWQP